MERQENLCLRIRGGETKKSMKDKKTKKNLSMRIRERDKKQIMEYGKTKKK